MSTRKIAYLGLGIMGRGMVSNLLKAGHDVTVWNRTPERAADAVAAGAKRADTPAAAVAGAELVLYCLADDAAVEAAVFGEDGVLAGVRAGQVAVDMSTVHPDTSRRQAEAYGAKGVAFVDAPVFGSKNEAANAGLWIVAGGERAAFDEVRGVLEILSESVHYMGASGQGAAMKLVGNLVVASQLEALGEALVLAVKAGLDPKDVLGVLKVTDFRSPIFDGVGQALVQRDFSTSFALKHLLKDTNLISRFAAELKAPTPGAAVARETVKSAMNHGWDEENASAMIKALERMAGVTVGG